ncbi:MAG: hypothetical protein KF782_03545 [Labilithrix sp.]|nr:hypothetical protein [Labilithrix sp.]
MTSGIAVLPAAGVSARDTRASRLVEFMLVGGATLVLFPLAWLLRGLAGLDDAELAVGFTAFYAAYVVNDPHFTVTYLLFYRGARRRAFGAEIARAQRARWIFAGVVAPIGLAAWAAAALALRSAAALGWMIQLMYLLVGWHYVKQGFGVVTVLSARRGFRMSPRERAAILFHCYAGWAFAWSNPAAPAGEYEEKGVVYTALAHPRWLELTAGAVLAISAVTLAAVVLARFRREGRTLPLAPLGGLLITVWSWAIFSAADPLVRYVIPALHSIQYLYFVWLMKRNEARAEEGPPAFGRPVAVRVGLLALTALGLGVLVFHLGPTFLDTAFAPRPPRGAATTDPLGETPYFAAIFVFVNIHHYFMDHVIWRRENPDTRWLREPAPG